MARSTSVAVGLVSPPPPRPSPSPVGPRGFPLAARSTIPEGTAARASLLRSTPEPYRTPWPRMAFSPGFPSTQRGNAYLAMCPSPLHRHASEASTPAPAACRRFGPEGSTPEVLFHPRGFSPPRWVPPLHPLRACCIPLPILGFAAFPCLAIRSKTGPRDTSPRRRTYPSKNSPSTAVPRHRGRCAPCRSLRITAAPRQGPLLDSCSDAVGGSEASASRLCSVIGSGTPRHRCRRREIRSFLGFVPLQGSRLATGASAPPSSRQPLGARRRFVAGKLRFALPSASAAPPKRGPTPRRAPPCARDPRRSGHREATGVGTTPERQVPGPTEAHDPRTAAVGG